MKLIDTGILNKDQCFRKFLEEYEIICLSECSISSISRKKKGRAKKGMLIGIKKLISEFNKTIIQNTKRCVESFLNILRTKKTLNKFNKLYIKKEVQ